MISFEFCLPESFTSCLRELVLSPQYRQIQSLNLDYSYQEAPVLAKEVRHLVISNPVRSVVNITNQACILEFFDG